MESIRWLQRFENFEKAVNLLEDAVKQGIENLSDLEKEGVIQRFEYTFELAWKTIKDYLEYGGIVFEVATPRHIIKQAFAAGVIKDGQVWIDMLESRNIMSHTYDDEIFAKAINCIADSYFAAIKELYDFLNKNRD